MFEAIKEMYRTVVEICDEIKDNRDFCHPSELDSITSGLVQKTLEQASSQPSLRDQELENQARYGLISARDRNHHYMGFDVVPQE